MIEHQTIDGREATIAYLNADWSPADASDFTLAKVIFDDGEIVFLSNSDAVVDDNGEGSAWARHRHKHAAPLSLDGGRGDSGGESEAWARHRYKHAAPLVLATDDPGEVPVKLQLIAWAKAIMVLDASEVLIRDLIERELAGRTGTTAGPQALLIARQLSGKIAGIRQDAIKLAFRLLRGWLRDEPILDISLSRWAQYFDAKDANGIAMAIQTGLIAGLDNVEIARKVVGSMALNGVDGVTEFTRHKIAHLGRAAIKESAARAQQAP